MHVHKCVLIIFICPSCISRKCIFHICLIIFVSVDKWTTWEIRCSRCPEKLEVENKYKYLDWWHTLYKWYWFFRPSSNRFFFTYDFFLFFKLTFVNNPQTIDDGGSRVQKVVTVHSSSWNELIGIGVTIESVFCQTTFFL